MAARAITSNVVVTVGGLANNALIYSVTVASTSTSSPSSSLVETGITITRSSVGATTATSAVTVNGARYGNQSGPSPMKIVIPVEFP